MLEAKDQGHRRKCSPKKKVFTNFSGDLQKQGLQKFFQAIYKILAIQKILLCSRAEDRAIFEDLKLRGQGQKLDLRGQGHQNVSSRTPLMFMAHHF